MSNLIIAPSILSANWGKFAEEVLAVEHAGADWIHIDVMDGQFVPPITFGAELVKTLRRLTKLPLDVHLMVLTPEQQIEQFVKAGADSITIHFEATNDPTKTLKQIRSLGCKAGLALKPQTDVSKALPLLAEIDLLLVMSVNPGYSGQAFIPETLSKIRAARKLIQESGLNIKLQVDGGVKADSAKECVQAGANVLVAASYIYHSSSYKTAINSLRLLNT
ncbi:ribulose-phosphate 3-epimerase [bacterium]|nr:ribulose-phosphate 3-epimerase [bacterium]